MQNSDPPPQTLTGKLLRRTGISPAFFHHQAAGGIVLMIAAALAIVLANSPLAYVYAALLDTPVTVRIGEFGVDKNLLHWINDGLMAIFFFLVGLEIKRELLTGELSSVRKAALPAIAAVGGMVVPAMIYVGLNSSDPRAVQGWAIPTATDIAFALGVLALVGPRVPPSLKVFLLALAIIDDLGAVLIIAFFYTANLSVQALSLAAIGVVALIALNVRGVDRTAPYLLVGLFIWLCVLKSGVHATLAGVVTALAIPLLPANATPDAVDDSLAVRLQDSLHSWVTFGVLPAFAFANAGVSLAGLSVESLAAPIPLGIALGLLLGKPIGVFLFTAAAVALGVSSRPEGASWLQLVGIGLLAGIGFTMSLFIGMLAFPEPSYAADIRLGVLSGSIFAALLGYTLLRSVGGQTSPR